MKILIDGRLYGLENAGLGRYVINLVGELSKIDQKNSYVLLLPKKHSLRVKLPSNWKVIPVEFRHYGFFEQLLLPRIIKKEGPDLVHFPHFNIPVWFGGNFVVTVHDMLMHKQVGRQATTLSPPMYYLKRLGYKTVFNAAVKKAVQIIAPSRAVKEEIIKYYGTKPEKVSVIYEGFENLQQHAVGFDFAKAGITKPYIAYVGNAYPHKNLKRLIEATVSFNKSHGYYGNKSSQKKVMLAIASSRSVFTQRLKKTIEDLGGRDYVRIVGFVPDGEMSSFLSNSLALFTPSLSEGFGLPGLEAMSTGCLVAASDIPVYKEVYEKHVIYFNPLDFSSIESSIEKIVNMSKSERDSVVLAAKVFAKKYSWSKMARETLQIYEKTRSDSLRSGK